MWQIIEQEETQGREKVNVKVKNVKFFPITNKAGDVSFGKLKFLLLQIVLENEKGERVKVKLNASKGVNNPTFVLQYEDTFEYPKIWVGEGRKRQQITDRLSDKVKVPGRQDRYDDLKSFSERLTRMVGKDMAGDMLQMFAEKLADVAGVRKAA